MAELLVRVVDKTNDDPYLDVRCTKRGDVIVVKPDGWAWGKQELANPDWRIVKIDASIEECLQLLAPELPQSVTPDRMTRKRAFKIDLDKLDAGVTDLAELKVTKNRLVDPGVIGEDKRVIG